MPQNKLIKLDIILKDLESYAVAFSGGVDSSLLLYRAHRVKKKGIIALTIRTPYIPAREIEESVVFAKKYGIRHEIIDLEFPDTVRNNTEQRCYFCKKTIFTELLNYAQENNFRHVIDGSNADDSGEFRPGLKALTEMGIRSPLMEAGLTKSEIRELSKTEGLDLWDKPAMACLLTRIPYNTVVTVEMLRMIEKAEEILFEMGYPGTRVRIHGDLARIECLPGYLEKIIRSPAREQIITNLKKTGFRFVTLDLQGYRTGSSDPENMTE